jgi:hypothetical protein
VISLAVTFALALAAAGPPAEAEAQFALKTLPAVRRAASLWLSVASAEPGRLEPLVGVARAQIWLGVHEPEASARTAAARAAVEAGEHCAERSPSDPRCSYWLGVALGVQARERGLAALGSLRRMVRLLEAAATAEPTLDHGGPNRVLALIYLRAPGWPLSVGDDERGLEHARAAVAVQEDFPPNQLALGEAFAKTGEAAAGRVAFLRGEELARTLVEQGDPEAPKWLAEAEQFLRRSERR